MGPVKGQGISCYSFSFIFAYLSGILNSSSFHKTYFLCEVATLCENEKNLRRVQEGLILPFSSTDKSVDLTNVSAKLVVVVEYLVAAEVVGGNGVKKILNS